MAGVNMLKPLPDIENESAMQKLGRASALRNARFDAIHELRNAIVRLQSSNFDEQKEIDIIRYCINRLEEIASLSNS